MKDVIWFDHLSGRDLQNGAVIDEIRDVFKVNKELLEVCKKFVEYYRDKQNQLGNGQAYKSWFEMEQAIQKAEGKEER